MFYDVRHKSVICAKLLLSFEKFNVGGNAILRPEKFVSGESQTHLDKCLMLFTDHLQ